MKKLSIIILLMFLFSCSKKELSIKWEKNKTFAEVLESAGEEFVMIDFLKNG